MSKQSSRLAVGLVCALGFGTVSAQTLISSHTDASGLITVGIFEQGLSPSPYGVMYGAATTDVILPSDWVAIGGGMQTEDGPNCPPGFSCPTPFSPQSKHLLTASAPILPDMNGWRINDKDHYYWQWKIGKAYAIGLKIQGLSRSDLRSLIAVSTAASANVSHPDMSVSIPGGHVLIGGGIAIVYTGAGNLATALYPSSGSTWRVKSKDHAVASLATAYAHAISLPQYIPGVGNIGVTTTSATSGSAQQPSAYSAMTPGYALTGCGADVYYGGGQGSMLWKVRPQTTGGNYGCEAGSKDVKYVSNSNVTAYAIGIYVY